MSGAAQPAPGALSRLLLLLLFACIGALVLGAAFNVLDQRLAPIAALGGISFAAATGVGLLESQRPSAIQLLLALAIPGGTAFIVSFLAHFGWPEGWVLSVFAAGPAGRLWLPRNRWIWYWVLSVIAAAPALLIPAAQNDWALCVGGALVALPLVPSWRGPLAEDRPSGAVSVPVLVLQSCKTRQQEEVVSEYRSPSGAIQLLLVEAGPDYVRVRNSGADAIRIAHPLFRTTLCTPGEDAMVRPGHSLNSRFDVVQVMKAGTTLAALVTPIPVEPKPARQASGEYLALDEFD